MRTATAFAAAVVTALAAEARSDPAPPPAGAKAERTTVVAAGGWSDRVGGLRGRLVLARGKVLGDGRTRESVVYVELEYAPDAVGRDATVLFDPDALRCELTDAAGRAVPQSPYFGSGGRPGKTWVTLPYDSGVRLRASPYAHGRAEGFLIPLNGAAWHVADAADYHFVGTLTVAPPADRPDAWKGELRLPRATLRLTGR
jgi:hypothetical protein